MGRRYAPLAAALLASTATLAALGLVMYFALPWPARSAAPASLTDDVSTQATAVPQTGPAEPTIASLTPAGTDLLIGIGAADHLVAVSDLDDSRAGVENLPRVGDFDHVDWEKLAAANPKILLTQFGSRIPTGLTERCQEMGIRLVDVRLNVLQDVYDQADRLADLLGVQTTERPAVADLKRRLAHVAAQWANTAPVRAAIAVSDGGAVGLIGPGSFHDQLLSLAGGVNVAAGFNKPYVSVDREQLMSLAPDVVLDLEPQPPTTPQQMRQAARFWDSLPDLPAARAHRVRTITDPYCLQPGWHLAELAEVFAENLHDGGVAGRSHP